MVAMARDSLFHAPRAGTQARTGEETPSAAAVDWDELRRRMRGALLRPGNPGFDDARKLFNPLNDDHIPAAVAQCASVADVSEAVLAAGNRVPLAARSGGHSYVGYSAPHGGLTLDLRRLSAVEVQPDGTATVGAGAVLRDVYSSLGQANRCLPGGSCFTVGIAGVTLGGGIGVLQRKFGLTCDHLLAAEIVTADGRALTASATRTPDLFWALRGGGGGNFGVVTQFTFATDPAPALTVFVVGFPAGKVAEVLSAWQPWITAAPRELWANLNISGGSPPSCRVAGCFVGPSSTCNPLLDDLVSRSGVLPDRRTVQDRDYFNAMRFFSGKPDRESFVASSRVLSAPTPDPAALAGLLTGRTGMAIILDALGGAVADVGVQQTAFPHRTAFATAQIYAGATAASEAEVTRSVGEVVAGLNSQGIGGGYVNYIDPALPDWAKAYYGPNLERLRSVAHDYDPDNVFDFAQAVSRA
ncbi:FAD-binding oxidoreductase [Streptomyces inhibens]|uniref:FAD-binding oxidoreductase n=2 Tax=Streptomyces inhibens TaxID=2293571 RepID=A0A371PQT5_STRIH|nr:FAD-binding oxidoreductase [Streptomyces inhibens]